MITLDPEEKAVADPPKGDKKKGSSCSCLSIIVAFFLLNILLGPLSMLFMRLFNKPRTGRPPSSTTRSFVKNPSAVNLRGCQSNMKNIATALEMYSTDNQGYYPPSMKTLTPRYLKNNVNVCPSAGIDTYSPSYVSSKTPANYTFYCQGNYHMDAGLPSGFPQYTSIKGLSSGP